MPDYIYLLENRLSADQQHALRQVREAAREAGMILFLTGDAVRDLTSGQPVRDLEVSVHGNALKLRRNIENLGGSIWGESELSNTLYLCFPGTVRVDLVSTHRMDYTRIETPVYHPASIQEDLRRRDFTVNAMAISLNEGSFGLLMDPLNGAADIEARTLRLVSNYGFIEDPSLLIRATRYKARLGWELDSKTLTRYDNARADEVIERLSPEAHSRELEQIAHEADGLKILRALEDEGWMKFLFPSWTVAKVDEEKLKALHELAGELLAQGVRPDMSAPQMQLLTARLSARDLAALKKQLLRPGFVAEWNGLDAVAAKFAKVLLSKENAAASAGFKLFTSYDPEAVLWLGFTSSDKAVQEQYNRFLKVWPEARQRTPHALLQEMRITPELATYKEIVHSIFLELIDGKLGTAEEMRAFLEPHSPPAPPPQVTVKRPRGKRGEAKVKERSYDDDEESEDGLDDDEEMDDLAVDDDDVGLGIGIPKVDLEPDLGDDNDLDPADDEPEGDEPEPEPVSVKRTSRSAISPKSAPSRAVVETESPAPTSPVKGRPGDIGPQAVAADVPVQQVAPRPKKSPGPPEAQKDENMADARKAAAPGVKPPQQQKLSSSTVVQPPPSAPVRTPGVKPPQAGKPVPMVASALALKPGKAAAKPAAAKAAPRKPEPPARKAAIPAKTTAPAKKVVPAKKTVPVKKAAKKR